MSTSSCIGILLDNQKVKYITVRSDGYLSFKGAMLQCGYTSAEKVNALIDLGCLSSIGYNINPPKKFKDYMEISAYYCCSLAHIKTSFCISYIRDTQSKSEYNKTQICSLKQFFEDGYGDYGYLYDMKRKCWFAHSGAGDSELYNLNDLFTDKTTFMRYRNAAGINIKWGELKETYAEFKADIACKGEHTILGQYNDWLKKETFGRGLEFGFAVRDGKRVYAVLRKTNNESGRRKVLMYSPNITDLAYALYRGEVQRLNEMK